MSEYNKRYTVLYWEEKDITLSQQKMIAYIYDLDIYTKKQTRLLMEDIREANGLPRHVDSGAVRLAIKKFSKYRYEPAMANPPEIEKRWAEDQKKMKKVIERGKVYEKRNRNKSRSKYF